MSLLCNLFGHQLDGHPAFIKTGEYVIACGRDCGFSFEGKIPTPHIHKWSRPYTMHPMENAYGVLGQSIGGYVKRCTADGCTAKCAVKKRQKKGVANES